MFVGLIVYPNPIMSKISFPFEHNLSIDFFKNILPMKQIKRVIRQSAKREEKFLGNF